jgi:hypothetical protein
MNNGYLTDQGYIKVIKPKEHPNKGRYIFLHRLVMEKKIGRYLTPIERVHHIDGNKQNNNPDNLQLFKNQSEHGKGIAKEQRKYLKLWEGKWLYREYINRKRPYSDIAKELKCNEGTVRNALKIRNIPMRRYTLTEESIKARIKGAEIRGQQLKNRRRS